MADNLRVTADDVLGAPTQGGGLRVTAQDVIDAVPVDRKLQPQFVDEATGQDFNVNDLDSPSAMGNTPRLRVEQRPTGVDQNVQRGSSGFKANFKAGFVEDPRVKIAQHAKALFPNDPSAASRFGIRDGKIVYIDDDLSIKDVDSGFKAGTGNALAYTPETVGGIVGSFATGSPMTGAAVGSVGGKAVKQIIANTIFDDPQTWGQNLRGMATEGLTSWASGGIAKGAGKFLDKSRVVDFTPAQAGAAQATRDTVRNQTGITLDLAQASQDPALMSLRKYAAKFPGESSQIFKQLDELQTSQSADAMQRLIGTVSKSMSSEAAGRQGINAAQEAIRAARAGVSQKVKPLYDAAYAAVPEVTDPKILGMLKLPGFPQAHATAQRLLKLEEAADGATSLRALDYTKRGLDDRIDKLMSAGSRQEARALKIKRDEFVKAIDATPNQQWKDARKAYGDLAKSTIEPLENGAVGALSRIKDPKAATAAAKIFSDPAITPAEISFARAAVERADPEAWRALSGQYLAGVLDKSLKVTQKGETANLAGKLYQAMAGTPQQAAKLRASLPANAQAQLGEVLGALKLVAATERAGSDTAFNQLVTRKIEGRFSTTLKLLRQPVQTAIQAGEERSIDKLVTNLAKGLTDPGQIAALKQVSKTPPGVLRGMQILSIVAVGTGGRAAEDEVNPLPDTPIPALEPRRGAGTRPPTRGIP